MKAIINLFWWIIWPPAAHLRDDDSSKKWWAATCVLNVLVLAAVLHNVVFWRHNCMLIPFGPDYTPAVIKNWLLHDPSLPWAMIVSAIIYLAGRKHSWVRVVMAPVFISFLPVTIWIWDIPFTHRIICTKLHDGRSIPLVGIYLKTRHALLLSVIIYIPFIMYFLFGAKNFGSRKIR